MRKMGYVNMLILLSLECLAQKNGIYFTKEAFIKDSLISGYELFSSAKDVITFKHKGESVNFKTNELYAFWDGGGRIIRIHPKDGPLKMLMSGDMCLWGNIMTKIGARGEAYPEITAFVPNTKLYVSLTSVGDFIGVGSSSITLKKLLKDDPEILAKYKQSNNITQAVYLYNTKHSKTIK
ncbi:MAG: hypothetical protein J0M08_07995 [Bacteroidetes bacterium]|nr:hypothetical protein [Bacteroidota bacterium]